MSEHTSEVDDEQPLSIEFEFLDKLKLLRHELLLLHREIHKLFLVYHLWNNIYPLRVLQF